MKFAPDYTILSNYFLHNLNMTKRTSPAFILTYAELELLLAEAAQRLGRQPVSALQRWRDGRYDVP